MIEFLKRNFLKSGFIFDAVFSVAALFVTPVILQNTTAAKTGNGNPEFASLLIAAAVAEIIALTILLPWVFRRYQKNSFGFMILLLLWLAHFTLQMMLAESVIMRSLSWSDASTGAQALTIFCLVKEFYLGGLIAFAASTARREMTTPSAVVLAGQFMLAATGFLFYTIAFDGMSHAEILEGIDPNIADYFIYKIFHFSFVFLLIYFPARLIFVLEDKLSVLTQGDRRLYRAGLVIAIIGGTWGLFTGPEITPGEITAREERFGQTRLMQHITYAPLSYLERLIAAGADVNARDNEGRTALHKAVYNGRTSAIRLLLENKADPNIQMNDGTTALHLVFRQGWSGLALRVEMTEMLLKAGADPQIRDQKGRNFLESVEYGYKQHILPLVKE